MHKDNSQPPAPPPTTAILRSSWDGFETVLFSIVSHLRANPSIGLTNVILVSSFLISNPIFGVIPMLIDKIS